LKPSIDFYELWNFSSMEFSLKSDSEFAFQCSFLGGGTTGEGDKEAEKKSLMFYLFKVFQSRKIHQIICAILNTKL